MSRLQRLLLPVLLAACGDNGPANQPPDAAPPVDGGPVDGAPDASPDAPVAGIVRVTVTERDGAAVVGADVYFQNADGSLVATGTTNAAGAVSATMLPGGSVTVVQVAPDADSLSFVRTYLGVQPGDQLTLDLGNRRPPVTPTSITVPYLAGAATYEVRTTCNAGDAVPSTGQDAPQVLELEQACANPKMDVLAMALDAEGALIGYLWAEDVESSGPVALTAPYLAPAASTFTATGLADFTSVDVGYLHVTSRGRIFGGDVSGSLTAGSGTLERSRPVLSGTLVADYIPRPFVGQGYQRVLAWGPEAAAQTADVGAQLLPAYTAAPVLDPATATVTWTAGATGQAPDLTIASISFGRTVGDQVTSWRWIVAAPHAGAVLALPALPGAAAVYNPVAGDTINVYGLVTAKVPGGYDAVRAQALSRGTEWLRAGVATQATGFATLQDLPDSL